MTEEGQKAHKEVQKQRAEARQKAAKTGAAAAEEPQHSLRKIPRGNTSGFLLVGVNPGRRNLVTAAYADSTVRIVTSQYTRGQWLRDTGILRLPHRCVL